MQQTTFFCLFCLFLCVFLAFWHHITTQHGVFHGAFRRHIKFRHCIYYPFVRFFDIKQSSQSPVPFYKISAPRGSWHVLLMIMQRAQSRTRHTASAFIHQTRLHLPINIKYPSPICKQGIRNIRLLLQPYCHLPLQ